MKINLIVAISKNNAIGKNGKLPWKIKEDLKHFKKTTIGNNNNAILMGRKTWESIGRKPLINRFNIIISNNKNYNIDDKNVSLFNDIHNCLHFCKNKKFDNLWIIGGSSIYYKFLNDYNELIDKLEITYIDKLYDNCDTFINLCLDNFKPINVKYLNNDKNIYVKTYIRK